MAAMRGLYIFGDADASFAARGAEFAAVHLDRLCWSYNSALKLRFTTLASDDALPPCDPTALGDEPYVVAFVESDAPPAALAFARRSSQHVVIVDDEALRRKRHREDHDCQNAGCGVDACATDAAGGVSADRRTLVTHRGALTFDAFCGLCAARCAARLGSAPVPPHAARFEYHTQSVLEHVWDVDGARHADDQRRRPGPDAPPPLARYTLSEALDTRRAEALVLTRRAPPYAALYANSAFWEQTGWPGKAQRGRNLKFLHGELTSATALADLQHALTAAFEGPDAGDDADARREVRATLLNYTKGRKVFRSALAVTHCVDAHLLVGRIDVDPDADLAADAAENAAESCDQRVDTVLGEEGPPAGDEGARARRADTVLGTNLAACLIADEESIVVTRPASPFSIVFVNDKWCETCGFTPDQVVGKSLKIIQGPETDLAKVVHNLALATAEGNPKAAKMRLTNYKNGRGSFTNECTIDPILTSWGKAEYFVGRVNPVPEPADA